MIPRSQLPVENSFEGSQNILWVGIFIMITLVITPLTLACSCCLKKIVCPAAFGECQSDPNPIIKVFVILVMTLPPLKNLCST